MCVFLTSCIPEIFQRISVSSFDIFIVSLEENIIDALQKLKRSPDRSLFLKVGQLCDAAGMLRITTACVAD